MSVSGALSSNVTEQNGNGRIYRILWRSIASSFSLMVLYVMYSSRLFRPGVDDYCLGVEADRGIIGAAMFWWDTSSGYLFNHLGGILLVGLPVLHTPWFIASAIPFVVASLCVAIIGWQIVTYTNSGGRKLSIIELALILPLLAATWWLFLWSPVTWGQDGINRWMGIGLTHFQTLNGGYVFQITVVIGLSLLTWNLIDRKSAKFAFLAVLPGVLVGFSGIMLALTIALSGFLFLSMGIPTGAIKSNSYRLAIALGSVTALLGGIISHLAAGSRARAEVLGSDFGLSPRRLAEIFRSIFPSSLKDIFEAFVNPGTFGAIVLLALVGFLLTKSGVILSGKTLRSLVAHRKAPTLTLAIPITLFVIVTTAGVLLQMTISMSERNLTWESGSAPIPGIVSDTENIEGMEMGCWRELAKLRELPSLGGLLESP